jgi:hypothetical protein
VSWLFLSFTTLWLEDPSSSSGSPLLSPRDFLSLNLFSYCKPLYHFILLLLVKAIFFGFQLFLHPFFLGFRHLVYCIRHLACLASFFNSVFSLSSFRPAFHCSFLPSVHHRGHHYPKKLEHLLLVEEPLSPSTSTSRYFLATSSNDEGQMAFFLLQAFACTSL